MPTNNSKNKTSEAAETPAKKPVQAEEPQATDATPEAPKSSKKPTVSLRNNTDQKLVVAGVGFYMVLAPLENKEIEGDFESIKTTLKHLIQNNVIKLSNNA